MLETGREVTETIGLSALHRTIYQLSHLDPAIREAVVAIGSLGERIRLNPCLTFDNQNANDCHGFALSQYGIALNHLRAQMLEDPHRYQTQTLISCFLFTLFEFLQGNDAGALTHLQSGLTILRGLGLIRVLNSEESWSRRVTNVSQTAIGGHHSIDLQVREIRQVCVCGQHQRGKPFVSPSIYTEDIFRNSDGIRLPPIKPLSMTPDPATCELLRAFAVMEASAFQWLGLDSWEHPLLSPLGVRPYAATHLDHFPSVADAAASLRCQMDQARDLRRCWVSGNFLDPNGQLVPNIQDKRRDLCDQLERWLHALEILHKRLGSFSSGETQNRVRVMRINYEVTYIDVMIIGSDIKQALNALEPRFEKIISLARAVLDSLENQQLLELPSFVIPTNSIGKPNVMFYFCTGLIQPLFFTAVKSQSSITSGEAISLLLSRSWREGAWDSTCMAAIATKKRAQREGLL